MKRYEKRAEMHAFRVSPITTKERISMKVKEAQKLRDTLFIVGIVIMLCAAIYEPLFELLTVIGAVIAFSGLIPHFLYNKCPSCGKQLGRNDGKYCQHCGKALD